MAISSIFITYVCIQHIQYMHGIAQLQLHTCVTKDCVMPHDFYICVA